MSNVLSAPAWLVITLLVIAGLLLIAPYKYYRRGIEMMLALHGTSAPEADEHAHATSTSGVDADSRTPSVGRVVLIATAVLAAGIPLVWRRRFRSTYVEDLTQLPRRSAPGYVLRVLIRIPALRRALADAVIEAERQKAGR